MNTMNKQEINEFIEKMEEVGDVWPEEQVNDVYGDSSFEEALADRQSSLHDTGTTGRTSPKAGDNTNLWLPIALMIGAAGLASGILCGSKKKKKQNKQDKKAD